MLIHILTSGNSSISNLNFLRTHEIGVLLLLKKKKKNLLPSQTCKLYTETFNVLSYFGNRDVEDYITAVSKETCLNSLTA